MGDFDETCVASGLGIPAGTWVRCVLLTASPFAEDEAPARGNSAAWVVRAPPIRARYDGYGSFDHVHPDDAPLVRLWLRGLREDLVERGVGDNHVHDVPVRRDLSWDDLREALQSGRVQVRLHADRAAPLSGGAAGQGAQTGDRTPGETPEALGPRGGTPNVQIVESALARGEWLARRYPDPVSPVPADGKFTVDAPRGGVVRVRFGLHAHRRSAVSALRLACAEVERAGFAAAVVAGTGHYPDAADLLVFPAPGAAPAAGLLWEDAPDGDRALVVRVALVRDDVWRALANLPEDRTGGAPFPASVPCVTVPGSASRSEATWYGLDAYRWGIRTTWAEVDRTARPSGRAAGPGSPAGDRTARPSSRDSPAGGGGPRDSPGENQDWSEEERALVDKYLAHRDNLPPEERRAQDAYAEAVRVANEAASHAPTFRDFPLDYLVRHEAYDRPGVRVLVERTPGVLGVPGHLATYLADGVDVPDVVLDAVAELAAVSAALRAVGRAWRPASAARPQYTEWDRHARFAHAVARVAYRAWERERSAAAGDGARDASWRLRAATTLDDLVERLEEAEVVQALSKTTGPAGPQPDPTGPAGPVRK